MFKNMKREIKENKRDIESLKLELFKLKYKKGRICKTMGVRAISSSAEEYYLEYEYKYASSFKIETVSLFYYQDDNDNVFSNLIDEFSIDDKGGVVYISLKIQDGLIKNYIVSKKDGSFNQINFNEDIKMEYKKLTYV